MTLPLMEVCPYSSKSVGKQKVQKFLQAYPIAKDFSAQIGRLIADSKALSQDENCLEKALATALADAYVAPEKIAADEEFFAKVRPEQSSLKDRIIQEYLDGLQQNLPPKSISTGDKSHLLRRQDLRA